ncbi:MAG: hypothetical protein J6V50_01750, partial [Clostridia bacterium]|nr:hypothetical protein [Clostridia bacterium]
PNSVKFEKNISADLSRLDFTINAMAYNPQKGVVDLFGGEEDIKNGIIKTVGTPEERFNEDALRILRAFRFASQLNYKIDEETENAAISLADTLCKLSGERVLSEIKKLAVGKNPFIISTLLDRGALLPFGIGNFRLMPKTFLDVEAEFRPVIFIFLCEHDNALIKENLKPDNKLLKQLEVLEEFFEIPCPRNKTDLKKIYSRYPDQIALYLNFVKLCFPLNYLEIRNLTYEILEESEPYLIAHLAIDGNEIKKLGITSAKIGETLISLLAKVIADPSLNTKEQLLNIISNKNK